MPGVLSMLPYSRGSLQHLAAYRFGVLLSQPGGQDTCTFARAWLLQACCYATGASKPEALNPGRAAEASPEPHKHGYEQASAEPNAVNPSTSAQAAQPTLHSTVGTSGAGISQQQHQPSSQRTQQGLLRPAQKEIILSSPCSNKRDRLLIRDFIQNSLYHPTKGYFSKPAPPVGSLNNPINYWKVYCQDEFNIMVKRRYKELEHAFLTPAELFTPWYGACLARHMVEHRKHNLIPAARALGTLTSAGGDEPIHIVEIGGGNGTLARDVLDWLREHHPQEYQQVQYTCMEISPSLASKQYDTVVTKAGHSNAHFKVRVGNAWNPNFWNMRDYKHCFVLMMEVMDNLPHDRVFRQGSKAPWQQTVAVPAPGGTIEDGPWQEMLEPVSDPLVQRCLEAVYRPPTTEQVMDDRLNRILDFILARDPPANAALLPGGSEVVWLPTACMALMEVVHDRRPNHSIIAADFDVLPDVKLPGRNAPLVAEKVGGENTDHDTLFVPWGSADIFFPTDFEALCGLYRRAGRQVWGDGDVLGEMTAQHFRQGAVLKRYREMFKTATISAFNPMIDDFINARFFLGDSIGRRLPGAALGKKRSVKKPSGPKQDHRGTQRGAQQQQQGGAKDGRPRQQQQAPEPTLGGRHLRQQPQQDGAGARGSGSRGESR